MRGAIVSLSMGCWVLALFLGLPDATSFGAGVIYAVVMWLVVSLPAGAALFALDIFDGIERKLLR